MEPEVKYQMSSPGIYTVLNGRSLDPVKPLAISVLNGAISSPAEWINMKYVSLKRPTPESGCIVVINEKQGTITFKENAEDSMAPVIVGKIDVNPDVATMHINTGSKMSAFELADVIKMNRTMMPDTMSAMELISKLRNFKANVEKVVEQFKDDKANFTHKQAQAATTNLPSTFAIEIEPVLDSPKQRFEVEIIIHPDLSLSLISPDLNDFIKQVKERLILQEITAIRMMITVPIFFTY